MPSGQRIVGPDFEEPFEVFERLRVAVGAHQEDGEVGKRRGVVGLLPKGTTEHRLRVVQAVERHQHGAALVEAVGASGRGGEGPVGGG